MRKRGPRFRLTSSGYSVNTRGGQSVEASRNLRPTLPGKPTPTTVLIGDADELVSSDERQWAIDNLTDVQLLDSDHVVLFRQPEVITQIILDTLQTAKA
jgi:pimeloyl-ACP methyl ester carboxylesterase